MSIILEEGKTVGVWYVAGSLVEGRDQDWLGHIGYEDIDGIRKVVLQYRFRYYSGIETGDPSLDGDRKSWYRVESTGEASEEVVQEAISAVRHIIQLIQVRYKAKSYTEILVKDFPNFQAFLDNFSAQPFAHVKVQEKPHEC